MKTIIKFIVALFILMIIQPVVLKSQTIHEGKKYLLNENYSKAIQVFRLLSSNSNGNNNEYFYIGKAYLLSLKPDSAKIYFENNTGLNKDNAYRIIGQGAIALIKGDTVQAAKYFDDAVKNDENNPEVYLNISDILLADKNLSFFDLKSYLEKAIKTTKQYSNMYKRLGDLYLSINDGSHAAANYKKSIDYDSTNAAAFTGLANVYKAVKDFAESENNYLASISVDSTYAVAYKELSGLYSIMDRDSESVEAYKKYLIYSENNYENKKSYAYLLYSAKKYEECRDLVIELTKLNPGDNSILHLLSYIYAQLNDPLNGIPVFEKYISLIPKNNLAIQDYELLSKLYLDSDQDSLAASTLLKILDLDSTKTNVYNKIALINYKIRNWNGVITALNSKLMATGKLNAQEYFDYGKALYFNKNYDEAVKAFDNLAILKPDFAIVYRWLGATKSNIDPESEKGLAKDDYEKFISLAENDSIKYKTELIEAYSYLGYYYYLKKDNDKSKKVWQKISILDPTNQQAIEAIKKIK